MLEYLIMPLGGRRTRFQRREPTTPRISEIYSPRYYRHMGTRRRHPAAHPRMSRTAVNTDHIRFERAEPPRADLPRDFESVAERMDPEVSGGILFRIAESEEGHQLRI